MVMLYGYGGEVHYDFINRLSTMDKTDTAVDINEFNHPLAQQIDWDAMHQTNSNFSRYRMVQTSPERLEGKMTLGGLIMVGMLAMFGLVCLSLAVLGSNAKLLVIMVGLLLLLGAGVLLLILSAPLVFDRSSARFYRGYRPKMGISACYLFDVAAVQVLHTPHAGSDEYEHMYEINLVCHDGIRVHVDQFTQKNIGLNARLVAAFLQVPLWDASGWLKQQASDQAPDLAEVTAQMAERQPVPWFMLLVPNALLLAGVLWWHWDMAQVIWLVFIEVVAASIVLILRSAFQHDWVNVGKGLALMPWLGIFAGLPAMVVYFILHSSQSGGEFDHLHKLPEPSLSWCGLMLGVLILARLLQLGMEYVRYKRVPKRLPNEHIIHLGGWLFVIVMLGVFLVVMFDGQAGLGFVIAIVLMRIVVTLGSYWLARWRKTGFA